MIRSNASELKERLDVLTLLETDARCWSWVPFHDTFGKVERRARRSVFSGAAASAEAYDVTLRAQKLTKANALLWRDTPLFVSSVESDRHWIKVSAAAVKSVKVERSVETYGKNELNNPVRLPPAKVIFPGWLAEKYVKAEREVPAVEVLRTYVLIVPKALEVIPVGDIIRVDGESYLVEVQHLLDADNNEYEIVYRGEA